MATKNAIIAKKRLFFEKLPKNSKKLVLVLANFILVTSNSGKEAVFKKIMCVYYLI